MQDAYAVERESASGWGKLVGTIFLSWIVFAVALSGGVGVAVVAGVAVIGGLFAWTVYARPRHDETVREHAHRQTAAQTREFFTRLTSAPTAPDTTAGILRGVAENEPGPDEEHEDGNEWMRERLHLLTEPQRMVLVGTELEDRSVIDMAGLLGASSERVRELRAQALAIVSAEPEAVDEVLVA